jgi:hypothetical protein
MYGFSNTKLLHVSLSFVLKHVSSLFSISNNFLFSSLIPSANPTLHQDTITNTATITFFMIPESYTFIDVMLSQVPESVAIIV